MPPRVHPLYTPRTDADADAIAGASADMGAGMGADKGADVKAALAVIGRQAKPNLPMPRP